MTEREKIQNDLSAYLDGELSSPRAGQIQQALADDAGLSTELDELRAVRNLLAALPRERAPGDLAESVLQRAERASLVDAPVIGAQGRPFRWMRYTAAAAMLVMATALGAMLVSAFWPPDIPPEVPGPLAHEDATVRGPAGRGSTVDDSIAKRREVSKEAPDHGTVDKSTTLGGTRGTVIANNDTHGKGYDLAAGTDNSSARRPKGGFKGGIVRLDSLPAATINEVIYTPAIANTQRRIETFLVSNSIRPIVTTSATKVADDPSPPLIAGRSNHYRADRVTGEQISIRIEAATLEQIDQIRAEIRRIRGEQQVSQVTIPGEMLAALRYTRRRGGYVGKGGPGDPAKPAPRPVAPKSGDKALLAEQTGGEAQRGEDLADGRQALARGHDKDKTGATAGSAEGETVDPGAAKPVTGPGRDQAEGASADDGKPAQKKRPDLPPGTAVAKLNTDRARGGDHVDGAGARRKPKRPSGNGATSDGSARDQKSDDNGDGRKSTPCTAPADGAGKVREGKDRDKRATAESASQPSAVSGGGTSKQPPAPTRTPKGGHAIAAQQGTQATTQIALTAGQAKTHQRGRTGPNEQDLSQIAGANVRTLVITLNFRSMVPYPPAIQLDATLRKEDVAPTDQSKK